MTEPHVPSKPVAGPHGTPAGFQWGPLGRLWVAVTQAPPSTVAFVFVLALGAAMFLPLLGAIGLYDPWESHYAEVAREMVARDDFVHPHWKEHYFFSKPVLLFWMTAAGFKVLDVVTGGGMTGPGNMPALTELAARLPVALIALLCLTCVYRFTNRFFGRTAAVIAGIALATMPFFALVARQHITDMPFVGLSTAATCLMAEAFFGTEQENQRPVTRLFFIPLVLATVPQFFQICRGTQLLAGQPVVMRYVVFAGTVAVLGAVIMLIQKFGRDNRAHLFYLLCGLAALAKGLAGVLLPGLVFLMFVVLSGQWWRLRRIQALTGTLVVLLVAAPWFVVMSLFTGKDDEGKTFFTRFFIHDHLNRLTGGVHGERGTFEYYIKNLGIGTVPWVGVLPFAWLEMATAHPPQQDEDADRLRTSVMRFVALWALVCFGLFSISATKFHHYILPMVPPLAICAGAYLGRLWDTRRNPPVLVMMSMVLGNVILALDMARNPYLLVDVFTYHYVSYKPDYYFPRDWPYGPAMAWLLGGSAAAMFLGYYLHSWPGVREAFEVGRWRFLFRSWRQKLLLVLVDGVMLLPEMLASLVAWPISKGRGFVAAVALAGVASGYFFTQVYIVKLAPHWSQRYLFNTYHAMKQGDEPIIAYLMNWRGESFYSKGTEPQINDGNQLKNRLKAPGREFVLVETTRYKGLESLLAADFRGKVQIVDRSNAKWFLVLVDD